MLSAKRNDSHSPLSPKRGGSTARAIRKETNLLENTVIRVFPGQ